MVYTDLNFILRSTIEIYFSDTAYCLGFFFMVSHRFRNSKRTRVNLTRSKIYSPGNSSILARVHVSSIRLCMPSLPFFKVSRAQFFFIWQNQCLVWHTRIDSAVLGGVVK